MVLYRKDKQLDSDSITYAVIMEEGVLFVLIRYLLLALMTMSNIFQFTSAAVMPAQSQNLSISNINHCTDQQDWISSGTYIEDCIAAVQRLYEVEVRPQQYPQTSYEFLTPNEQPVSPGGMKAMRTPRKYTQGIHVHRVSHHACFVPRS